METKFNLRRKIAFFSILKWFLAATVIGVIVGCFNALFLNLLSRSIKLTNSYHFYFIFLPFALFIVNYLANKVYPKDKGFSTNAAIASINDKKPISAISALKAFFLPILTIAAGGSAGKESPCADVGAGVAEHSEIAPGIPPLAEGGRHLPADIPVDVLHGLVAGLVVFRPEEPLREILVDLQVRRLVAVLLLQFFLQAGDGLLRVV